jgi:hypothetical protein
VKPRSKVVIVVVGYLAAFAVAAAVLLVYVSRTSGSDRATYGAMYEFGDSILFLGVLGIASLPATGAALFFLRGYRPFWNVLSMLAASIAAAGLLSVICYFAVRGVTASVFVAVCAGLTPFVVFAAPVFALAFLLSGVLAPTSAARLTLLIAAVIEVATFVSVVTFWFRGA